MGTRRTACVLCSAHAEAPTRIGRRVICRPCLALVGALLERVRANVTDAQRALWSRRACDACGRTAEGVDGMVIRGEGAVCGPCIDAARAR